MKTKIYLLLLATICAAGCTNRNKKHPTQDEECGTVKLILEESASVSDTQTAGEISNNAMLFTSGYGLNVYMEITGDTDCYDVCKLYIENSETHDIHLLLETKGANQPGTKLPIKARNKAAYGMNEYGIKEEAGYEDGYIESVEDVFVLSPSKILVRGIPDCRNYYYYIIDIENLSAVHIEEYNGYKGVVEKDGNKYLEFTSSDDSSGQTKVIQTTYDLSGYLVTKEDITAEYNNVY